MNDQEDIWAGTEFASDAKPAAAPEKSAAPSDDVWAGTEFAGKAKDEKAAAPAAAPKPDIYKPGAGPAPAADMPIGDVLKTAASNVPQSALHFGEAIVQPILHPIQTAEALGQLGTGVVSKAKGALGIKQDEGQKAKDEAAANALADFYKDRYGSMEGFKKAFMQDPVGILADASMIFTGGGSLAARLPGMAGKAGEIAAMAGRVADPINIATQIPKVATKAVTSAANVPLSLQSGVSFRSLQQAVDAGANANPKFWEHLSGAASPTEVVNAVNSGITKIAEQRSQQYLAGMDRMRSAEALPFDKVDQALDAASKIGTYKGRVVNPEANAMFNELQDIVNGWRNDPRMSHNLEDFDKLKQTIRNFGYSKTYKGTPARKIVDDLANAAKETIPDKRYAELMEQYSEATRELNDLTKELTVRGGSTGAQIRKLLKAQDTKMKGDLLKRLEEINPDLPYMLAGTELNPIIPQGIRGQIAGMLSTGAAGYMLHPGPLAGVALSSPRVGGLLNYGAGRVGGLPANLYGKAPIVPQAGFQAGRAEEVTRNTGGRVARASGGRISPDSKADQLVRAAETAKKNISKGTEALLEQPDEHIARALAVANRHI